MESDSGQLAATLALFIDQPNHSMLDMLGKMQGRKTIGCSFIDVGQNAGRVLATAISKECLNFFVGDIIGELDCAKSSLKTNFRTCTPSSRTGVKSDAMEL